MEFLAVIVAWMLGSLIVFSFVTVAAVMGVDIAPWAEEQPTREDFTLLTIFWFIAPFFITFSLIEAVYRRCGVKGYCEQIEERRKRLTEERLPPHED